MVDRYSPTLVTGLSRVVQVTTGNIHGLALDVNGQLYGFGSNSVRDHTVSHDSSDNLVLVSIQAQMRPQFKCLWVV
jgi:alpha-tubulin suppressor-like RCC1 family protein